MSDEFKTIEQFGWIHLEDGEGVTRVSMPKDVWEELCYETLKNGDRGVLGDCEKMRIMSIRERELYERLRVSAKRLNVDDEALAGELEFILRYQREPGFIRKHWRRFWRKVW